MRIWVRASSPDVAMVTFRRWFAWRPVLVGEYWVWLQTIERRDGHGEGNAYRDYQFADEEEDDDEI